MTWRSWPRTLASLVRWSPPHQLSSKLAQRTALEHRADALGDRHLDPEPPGEIPQHARRRQALHHLTDLPQRLLRGRAARHQLARPPVAAAGMPARDDQVAHAGEPGERLRIRTQRLAEPRDLDEPAGDERRLGVVSEPEPVDGTGGERDHVLRRRT